MNEKMYPVKTITLDMYGNAIGDEESLKIYAAKLKVYAKQLEATAAKLEYTPHNLGNNMGCISELDRVMDEINKL